MRRRLARLLLERGNGERARSTPSATRIAGAHDGELGLGEERLLDLAAEHRFGSIAGSFRPAGGPVELRRVAWWGSALADIGCAAGCLPRDEDLLADAARFYLAVALFDDVVDEHPRLANDLAPPLHPSRLRRKLERPTAPVARLTVAVPELVPVVALFDRALEGIGRRLRSEPGWREEVAGMLEAMYLSELGLGSDRLAAKILPFTLIGHLALRPDQETQRRFFGRLAWLLGLWDDWLDLVADGWALAPNAHLGDPSPLPPRRLRGVTRALWLTLMGAVPGHEVSRRLARALDATLEASRPLSAPARGKVEALLLQMLGAPGPFAFSDEPRPGARAPGASSGRAS